MQRNIGWGSAVLSLSKDGPNPVRAFVWASACRDGLGGDLFGVSGCDSRAEPSCTVGAAARMSLSNPRTASLEMADGSCVTKVNHFHNGFIRLTVKRGVDFSAVYLKSVCSGGAGGLRTDMQLALKE